MPRGNLSLGKVQVVVNHLECFVAQYFFERVDVPAVEQVVDGESVPEEVSVHPGDSSLFFQPREKELEAIFGNRAAVF